MWKGRNKTQEGKKKREKKKKMHIEGGKKECSLNLSFFRRS